MAVVIQNISPLGTPDNRDHHYKVAINFDEITTFVHRRDEGLAACLRRAADAVERKQNEEGREDG